MVHAATTVSSGPERVSLVELYTSEGCSSCPPADASLSELKAAEGLWDEFVPVAFHVTYWDRLGWEDRFARSRFDRRQKDYAGHWGHDVVYTPAFVIDGQEWRERDASRGIAAKARDERQQGRLEASVADGRVTIEYRGDQRQGLTAHAALLGFGLTTEVEAGENADRTLHHDFVALAHARGEMAAGEGVRTATVELATEADQAERRAIAVWVERRDQPGPVQAAGGWLAP